MKVLVCGGRHFNDKALAYHILDRIHGIKLITCIVHGNARGGDAMGKLWAQTMRIAQDIHKPNWDISDLTQTAPSGYTGLIDKYGNSLRDDWQDRITEPTMPRINEYGQWYNVKAGFNRNSIMLRDGQPDLVIAFKGGTGTADMVKIAKAAKTEVLTVSSKDSWMDFTPQSTLNLESS